MVKGAEQAIQDDKKIAQFVLRTEVGVYDYTPPAVEPIIAFDCGFADGIDGTLSGDTPRSMWSLELLATAKLATSLEDVATEYRYPPESWEPKLRRYEAREIAYAAKLKEIESGDPELREQRLRSEEHTSELQTLMRISYAVFCLEQKKQKKTKLITKKI